MGERNQTMHLAGALLRREWFCWAEAHSDEVTVKDPDDDARQLAQAQVPSAFGRAPWPRRLGLRLVHVLD